MRRGRERSKPVKAAHAPGSVRKLQKKIAPGRQILEKDLAEVLEQQSATSEILRVISNSPKDLQPVFDTIAERAARLPRAEFCHVFRFDGELLHLVAYHQLEREGAEALRRAFPSRPNRGSVAGRAILSGTVEQIPDILQDKEFTYAAALVGSYRSLIGVPILLEGMALGAIALARLSPGYIPERQIEVLKTFAAQAAIAIQTGRLFEEIDARNHELSEALDRQTATSDVLRVISRSPTDVQPVFDAIAESAARLCNAQFCFVFRYDGSLINFMAQYGATPEGIRAIRAAFPRPPNRESTAGRSILNGAIEEIPDVHLDREYMLDGVAESVTYRSTVAVPMMRDGLPIGAISIARGEPGLFPERHIAALQTFADQAVIAVENSRLFQELEVRTRELTSSVGQLSALAAVSQAVSATLDLETVLEIIVSQAVDLSGSYSGIIYQFDETSQVFRAKASHRVSSDHLEALRATPIRLGEGAIGRAGITREPVEIADVDASGELVAPQVRDILAREGLRAILAIPLVREGEVLGGLVVVRRERGESSSGTITTLQTFAAQSVLAIHNARLFEELKARTEELSHSLSELRKAQDRLIQTEKLASLGQLTAGIAHEIKNPLNFVNNFSSLSVELIDELGEALDKIVPERDAELNLVADMLRSNLEKIVQHGRRADSIVTNMLLHSRRGSGEHRPADINAILEESLNLAYHGARAEKQDFTITIEKSLDAAAGNVDLYPQEITRVLLNLISNGFYAVTKKKEAADAAAYEPTLTASTLNLGDQVEIRIRDNGTGIQPEIIEKMFDPFFTTKPAGEGTGLGLSLSHDIIVKQHAGTIEVESDASTFTEFRIVLPRVVASLSPSGGPA